MSPIASRLGFTRFTNFTSSFEGSFLAFIYSSIFCCAVLYSLVQIKFIIKIAHEDTPFRADICKSVKKIGLVIILTPVLLLLMEVFLLINFLSKTRFEWVFRNNWYLFQLFLTAFIRWFFYSVIGIFFLVIARVFNSGLQLKQENDLTV
jgi:hypothetical protein